MNNPLSNLLSRHISHTFKIVISRSCICFLLALLSSFLLMYVPRGSTHTRLGVKLILGCSLPGLEYYGNARLDLPERQVSVLVSAEHLPRPCSSGHVDRKYVGFLVHPTLLEDQYEEDGK